MALLKNNNKIESNMLIKILTLKDKINMLAFNKINTKFLLPLNISRLNIKSLKIIKERMIMMLIIITFSFQLKNSSYNK